MTRSILKRCIVSVSIVSAFACIEANVIKGTTEVDFNHNLRFTPCLITEDSTYTPRGRVYACTPATPSIDLFVAERDVGTCTWICHILAIGSPRPFYLSKRAFTTSTLTGTLNVTDRSQFVTFDTVRNTAGGRDSLPCYLPHALDTQIASGYFAVFQNSERQYVLAVFNSIMDDYTDCSQPPLPVNCTSHSYRKGYRIDWYLQPNRTLNFSGTITEVAQTGAVRPVKASPLRMGHVAFSLDGRRVDVKNLHGIAVIGSDKTGKLHRQILY